MNRGPTPEDWENALARVAGLEILCSQLMSIAMMRTPPELREEFTTMLKIQFEDRFPKMTSPAFQRAFMDCADRVLDSAVATCEGFDQCQPPSAEP